MRNFFPPLYAHFDGTDYDEAALAKKFDEWEAEVEAYVPPERLLKFSVKQGWGPLAQFLDRPVPCLLYTSDAADE